MCLHFSPCFVKKNDLAEIWDVTFTEVSYIKIIPLGVSAKPYGWGSIWFSYLLLGSHSWSRRFLFYFVGVGVDVDVGLGVDGGLFLSLNLLKIVWYIVKTREYNYIYTIYIYIVYIFMQNNFLVGLIF